MDKYDFMFSKDECHKMTAQGITVTAMINGMLMLEAHGDRASEIRMNSAMLEEFKSKSSSMRIFDKTIYDTVMESMSVAGVPLVVDDGIEDSIVVINGFKNDGMSVIKIFIGE